MTMRLRLSTFMFRIIPILLLALLLPLPATAQRSDGGKMVVTTVFDPESKQTFRVEAPKANLAELRKTSPVALRGQAETIRQFYAGKCASQGAVRTASRFMFHDFPVEASAFYAGLAMTVTHQIQHDPRALATFYEMNIADPIAHVAFAFFLVGSKSTTAGLGMMGLHFDPCKNIKNGRFRWEQGATKGSPGQLSVQPTRLQKNASFLVGPLGMTAGFMLSSMAHEFMADPDIFKCAAGLVRPQEGEAKVRRDTHCDRAYENWVNSRKITNYVPDLLSMITTSFVQGYLITMPVSKGMGVLRQVATRQSDKSWVIALRWLRIGSLGGGPLVAFGMQAVNAAIFVSVNEVILPYMKFPWERWIQGRDITSSINEIMAEIDRVEKNKWAWDAKPKAKICTEEVEERQAIYGGEYRPKSCFKAPDTPGKLVRDLSTKFKQWREFALQDSYMAHESWKQYLLDFQNTYTNAYGFYKDLLLGIQWKRTPGMPQSASVDRLFSAAPHPATRSAIPEDICLKPMTAVELRPFKEAEAIVKEALEEARQSRKQNAYEVASLEKILIGMRAVDCENPLPNFKWSDARRDDWPELQSKIRSQQYRVAIQELDKALVRQTRYTPGSPSLASMALSNPYARLRQILGDPRPLTEGVAYLIDLDSDPTIINQDMKNQHPKAMGYRNRFGLPTMSDYLLASMVCGPEAAAPRWERIEVYAQQKRSWLEKVGYYFGFNFDVTSRMRNSNSMLYIQYADKDADRALQAQVAPEPTFLPSAHKGIDDPRMIARIWGVRADFRPPRVVDLKVPDVCANRPSGVNFDKSLWDIHTAVFNVNGKSHTGLLDVLKSYPRQEILGPNVEQFGFMKWWESKVDSHVARVVDQFRKDFEYIVDHRFVPAFTRSDTKEYNGRVFEVGVSKSIESEAKLNLQLLGRSFLKAEYDSTGGNAETRRLREEFKALSTEFLIRLKLQTDLFADRHTADKAVREIEQTTYPEDQIPKERMRRPLIKPQDSRYRIAFEVNKEIIGEILGDLATLTGAPSQAPSMLEGLVEAASATAPASGSTNGEKLSAKATIEDVQGAVVQNLQALVTETVSYFEVVDTIRVPGIP